MLKVKELSSGWRALCTALTCAAGALAEPSGLPSVAGDTPPAAAAPATPAVGAPSAAPAPAEAVEAPSEDEADPPRFDASLRVMTGFEWSREERLASTGRVQSDGYGFFLSQARAELEGKLTKQIEAEVSVELADAYDAGVVSTSDKPLYLRDAFLNLRAKRYLQIRAGHFKRPVSALEHRNAGELQVRGRGLTNDLIIEDNAWGGRGLGAQLWGKLKTPRLSWALGAFEPLWAPRSVSRPKGVDVLGRLAIEPVDGLSVGVNGGLKTLDLPPYDDYETFSALGADIQLESRGFFVLVDGLYAELPLPASELEEQTAFGVVLLTSYDVKLGADFTLQPVLLGEYADASTEHSDSETLRTVFGLNGIIRETLRIMPQVEVVHWLGEPSLLSPTQSLSAYLMLSFDL